MKYPDRTVSKPVTGQEAKQLIDSLKNGGSMTTDEGRATFERILARRQASEKGNDPADGTPKD
jgi:hypothetical protein